jgi:hypothetical protein
MRKLLPVAATLLACGCGYVGEPMPPLLNIPTRIDSLAAIQRGSAIVIDVPIPRTTTEGALLKKPAHLELRAGPAKEAFEMEEWRASARDVKPVSVADHVAHYEIPVEGWAGREVVLGARAIGANGRDAGWSRLLVLQVVDPPQPPSAIKPEAVREGVRVSWQSPAPQVRVFRRGPADKDFVEAATVEGSSWVDARTEYGKTYEYRLQAVVPAGQHAAESERSLAVRVVPEDRFAPAVPAGLTAVPSTGSIELAWDAEADSDLAGYILYRASGDGALERLAGPLPTPAYSDRKIEPGKKYRYAVSAVDRIGNESEKSAPVEVGSL